MLWFTTRLGYLPAVTPLGDLIPCECRVPPLYKAEELASSEDEDDESHSGSHTLPDTATQPAAPFAGSAASKKLEGAGPSMAFQRLNLQRSAPSGTFSKDFHLKVRSFVQE